MAAIRLSQSELARRVGLNQSSINGLIRGTQRSSTKLHQIARELQTTPAYLTGESDDPDGDAPELDWEQRTLIESFSKLSDADRRALVQIAKSMAGGSAPSKTVHEPERGYKGER